MIRQYFLYNSTVLYDVEKGYKLARNMEYTPVFVSHQNVLNMYRQQLKRKRMYRYNPLNAKLDVPVLFGLSTRSKTPILIDGWHRLSKCVILGIPCKAILLTYEDSERVKIMTNRQ